MVRASIRKSSASPTPLTLPPLPPAPAHDALTPVDLSPSTIKREPTPFDELPMSHLISFPVLDSPTAPLADDSPHLDAFPPSFPPFSPSSSAQLRDPFDYYRYPNPPPLADYSMSFQETALKPQLHSIPDFTDQLTFPPPQPQPQQQQQQCIPTSHLFPSASVSQQPLVQPSPPAEEDGSPPPSASSPPFSNGQHPKKRPSRNAVSTKDFVPPDVSGLSKREARLVKNRAAAFLSRQRKREEFESMEIRVGQLEQENARLLALTQSSDSHTKTDPDSSTSPSSSTELNVLRTQLAQARQRAELLEHELSRLRTSSNSSAASASASDAGSDLDAGSPMHIKREPAELPKRAGLFGVVLLCALPSLLSLPPSQQQTAASAFAFGGNGGGSAGGAVLDWPGGMEIEGSAHLPLSFLNGGEVPAPFQLMPAERQPLLAESEEAEFEVSFAPAALPGKMRVRIESPGPERRGWEMDLATKDVWTGGEIGEKRRVRIALKRPPVQGAEGGEWEVEVR